MRHALIALLVLAPLAGSAGASPLDLLFRSETGRPPAAADCDSVAAQIGPEATWYGEYAGKLYDDFTQDYRPFAARGCFASEYACRVWQNQAITYSNGGPMFYTRCTPGAPG